MDFVPGAIAGIGIFPGSDYEGEDSHASSEMVSTSPLQPPPSAIRAAQRQRLAEVVVASAPSIALAMEEDEDTEDDGTGAAATAAAAAEDQGPVNAAEVGPMTSSSSGRTGTPSKPCGATSVGSEKEKDNEDSAVDSRAPREDANENSAVDSRAPRADADDGASVVTSASNFNNDNDLDNLSDDDNDNDSYKNNDEEEEKEGEVGKKRDSSAVTNSAGKDSSSSSSGGTNKNSYKQSPRTPAEQKEFLQKNQDFQNLTLLELREYFHLPIKEAAEKCNVGITVFKNKCRKLHINNWPSRHVVALNKIIAKLDDAFKVAPVDDNLTRTYRYHISELKKCVDQAVQSCGLLLTKRKNTLEGEHDPEEAMYRKMSGEKRAKIMKNIDRVSKEASYFAKSLVEKGRNSNNTAISGAAEQVLQKHKDSGSSHKITGPTYNGPETLSEIVNPMYVRSGNKKIMTELRKGWFEGSTKDLPVNDDLINTLGCEVLVKAKDHAAYDVPATVPAAAVGGASSSSSAAAAGGQGQKVLCHYGEVKLPPLRYQEPSEGLDGIEQPIIVIEPLLFHTGDLDTDVLPEFSLFSKPVPVSPAPVVPHIGSSNWGVSGLTNI